MSLIRNRPSPFTVLPNLPGNRQAPLAAICNPFPCGGDWDLPFEPEPRTEPAPTSEPAPSTDTEPTWDPYDSPFVPY